MSGLWAPWTLAGEKQGTTIASWAFHNRRDLGFMRARRAGSRCNLCFLPYGHEKRLAVRYRAKNTNGRSRPNFISPYC